jgi:hypothetical protein
MTPCKFTFDTSPAFDGFAHGSTWNGFDNVAVTKEVLNQIIDWFASDNDADHLPDMDTLESFAAIEPMDNGLFSLGWGFATQIVEG